VERADFDEFDDPHAVEARIKPVEIKARRSLRRNMRAT
jgi:hypothetical protein